MLSSITLRFILFFYGKFHLPYASRTFFGTLVDQVKRLLALNYGRFEALRHKIHCKLPFKKTLVKGR